MVLTLIEAHTTGVNWELVIAIVSCVVVVMTTIIGIIARLITSAITSSIDKLRLNVVVPLDKRITVIEQRIVDFYTPKKRIN